MKSILTKVLLAMIIAPFFSCLTKPVKTKFETSKIDTATDLNEIKLYILKKYTINSDFNYAKLADIDSSAQVSRNARVLRPIFEPVKGKYNYYQFLATYKGYDYKEFEFSSYKDFHDIIIIKTDNANKIIDAYQYTLDWAEPPLKYDLFKFSNENQFLKDQFEIQNLKFLPTYGWNDSDKELKEPGIIKL